MTGQNINQSNIIWKPQPRQAEFMARGEWEALYGGAAGGGKSEALVMEALRQVHIPYYKCLIVRKTYPQLRELIDKSLNYYKQIYPRARYNSTSHTWTFPSGAKIIFGAMQYAKDRTNYQGLSFDTIMFDEITHFTFDEYSYLFSRCRPNGPGTQCYIRCTGNPGGIGHSWVRQRFIDAAEPMTTVWSDATYTDLDGKVHHGKRSRVFIPSTVFDNKILLENDPTYILSLASLPEADKQALLYGNWDSFSGQVFSEWRNIAEHYDDRIGTHVINDFHIPSSWSVWCGLDWGYSHPFAVLWVAVDQDRRMYLLKEYYGSTETPNTGLKLEPSEVARNIKAIEESDPNLHDYIHNGGVVHRVGDPAIWQCDGTESIGALMERERVVFERGDNARIQGKMQIHHRLAFDEGGIPLFYCFKSCVQFIRTFPALVYDDTHVEDVDTDSEDHLYDAFRYICQRNPVAMQIRKDKDIKKYDPLSDDTEPLNRYDFFRRF